MSDGPEQAAKGVLKDSKPKSGLLSRTIGALSWTALLFIVAVAILLHWAGDASWQMILLTFGPRWVVLVPLAPLIVAALLFRRRALIPLALAAICALGPVMGFCVPWRSVVEFEPRGDLVLRVVTLNPGGIEDHEQLVRFLRESEADVICLQEWFPDGLPRELGKGWHFARAGELFIASRHPVVEGSVSPGVAERRWKPPAMRCKIDTPAGAVFVHCVHLYTLRQGLNAVIADWWDGAPELDRTAAIRNEESELVGRFARDSQGPSLVLGDLNLVDDSQIYARDWQDWQNAFSRRGFGLGYTFGSSQIGLRIDHILADAKHWHIRSCRVGPDLGGQHRPVIAELVLLGKRDE